MKLSPFPSPGGRFENSPAVRCRVRIRHSTSPEGTAETIECDVFVPIPILWQQFSRPFGTRFPYSTIPPLKGWAIVTSPSGRQQTNSLQSVSIRTTICESLSSLRKFSDARVAQIFNLLYRRFSTCGPRDSSGEQGGWCVLPIANRRYSRMQLCATLVAASPRCVHAWFEDFISLPPCSN